MHLTEHTYHQADLLIPAGKQVEGKVHWSSPSNIALVKYWGKHGNQLPMNPSISFTLNNSLTETSISYRSQQEEKISFTFTFEGKEQKAFEPKLIQFFNKVQKIFPFINQLHLDIASSNTFPHSAGIASSASAMSALAICLCEIEQQIFNSLKDENQFWTKASYVSRLGSGSACRSVYGGLVNWGSSDKLSDTSDYAGTKLDDIHPVFESYRDSILIISSGTKKVSSTVGHGLMDDHPFAEQRFRQAREHHSELVDVLKNGNIHRFIEIVESEALSLHAMMMTSHPGYLLMEPGTIEGITKIQQFRKDSGIPVCFTLDAGPNIHLLYPESDHSEVNRFISMEFSELLNNKHVIFDRCGNGPQNLE